MSFTKVLIHFIWSTKNRANFIKDQYKQELLDHISRNAREKQIFIDTMNCVQDHIHILISLQRDQTMSKVAQLIKGESSYWWNKNALTNFKFEWQDDYMAFSVSDSIAEIVRNYIRNQEEHHRIKSLTEELEEILKEVGEKYTHDDD